MDEDIKGMHEELTKVFRFVIKWLLILFVIFFIYSLASFICLKHEEKKLHDEFMGIANDLGILEKGK